MHKDSILNTFVVAIGVCLVCSFLVSSAAVGLRDRQEKNAEQDRKKNILLAAGFSQDEIHEAGGVFEVFESRVEPVVIKLETGKSEDLEALVEGDEKDKITAVEDVVEQYDQIKASKIEAMSEAFEEKSQDIAGITRKEKWSHVYLVKGESGDVEKYVFPIRGKGLWSILKGFIAVETDFQTIAGLTYYEHAETPGLGGEVDNVSWKAKWKGKAIYSDAGDVEIEVIKGIADNDDKYAIDGLSGATITSRGVTNMLRFWLGPEGFGPYIQNQKSGSKVSAVTKAELNNG